MFFSLVKYAHDNNGAKMFREKFCAWQHGPVVNNIYLAYSGYQKGQMKPVYSPLQIISDKKILKALNEVLEETKDVSTQELIARTHYAGSPWAKVYDKKKTNVIPFDLIKSYYCESEKHYNELFPIQLDTSKDVRESSKNGGKIRKKKNK